MQKKEQAGIKERVVSTSAYSGSNRSLELTSRHLNLLVGSKETGELRFEQREHDHLNSCQAACGQASSE